MKLYLATLGLLWRHILSAFLWFHTLRPWQTLFILLQKFSKQITFHQTTKIILSASCVTFSHIYFKPLKLSCCVPITFCLFISSKCTIFMCKYCSKYHGVSCLILLHFMLLKRVLFDSKLDVGFLYQVPEFAFDVQARRYT